MVDTITENGGVVSLNSEVSSITYKNNIATGISLKNGDTYTSKYIVSNMNPSNTFNIIENYNIPIKYKKSLESPSIGCTLNQLYIWLDCNPKDVWINSVYGYSQVIKQARRHRLKSETPIDNLFLVEAWVKPGGGYEGAISSGMIVAQNIDKFLNGIK